MKNLKVRFGFTSFVAAVVAAGHLWVPDPAQAEAVAGALFRVKRSWHGYMVTTAMGARYDSPYVSGTSQPRPGANGSVTCTTNTTGGGYGYRCYDHPNTMDSQPPFNYEPPATAIVGKTTGAQKVTLPRGFIHFGITAPYSWSCGIIGKCNYPGVGKSIYYLEYSNYRGFFQPQNPYAPNAFTVLTFPTVGGTAMLKDGTPVTPTTRFSGRFDKYRAGSIKITPGPNKFGGTMRYFVGQNAGWYLFHTDTTPYEIAYGRMWRDGVLTTTTTPDGALNRFRTGNLAISENSPQRLGMTYPSWEATRINTSLTTGGGELATRKAQIIRSTAPWTTGRVEVYQPLGSIVTTATVTGYDNRTPLGLHGKLSLVVPWLVHGYVESYNPADPVSSGIHTTVITKVTTTFLPEPAVILQLGAGILGLVGLYRLRRR
jgi:hypothetical protein